MKQRIISHISLKTTKIEPTIEVVDSIYSLCLRLFSVQNELNIISLILFDVADQLIISVFVGDTLDDMRVEHICASTVPDGEYLLSDSVSHRNPPPFAHGQFHTGSSARSRYPKRP